MGFGLKIHIGAPGVSLLAAARVASHAVRKGRRRFT